MKKEKILIGFIIGIFVVIVGIIAAMFATGKFDTFRKEDVTQATTIPVTETTTEAPVQGRPKTQTPASIVATVYSEYSDASASDISVFAKLGFNTVIFELTEENADKVASLIETAKSAGIYSGVRADISEKSQFKSNVFTLILLPLII